MTIFSIYIFIANRYIYLTVRCLFLEFIASIYTKMAFLFRSKFVHHIPMQNKCLTTNIQKKRERKRYEWSTWKSIRVLVKWSPIFPDMRQSVCVCACQCASIDLYVLSCVLLILKNADENRKKIASARLKCATHN